MQTDSIWAQVVTLRYEANLCNNFFQLLITVVENKADWNMNVRLSTR